ncbi:cytidylate kinase [Roseivirga sp. 4D4]|uniref:(d)CMP kinase n=1 Tax=Roseivirga sp. 4D4 TaxID=1889784 RepID=UPI0008530E14|nr:(d)CMP kinase [Roseivirga sp. 4D4]OEK01365.1 cytidylate kinase [Roseivirga sp. 4D4]
MTKINIAIDGLSGCGKSSTAKAVAKSLHYKFIDTGAMYRAVTLYFLQHNVDLSNHDQVVNALSDIQIDFEFNQESQKNETILNQQNVEQEIRKMYVSEMVSPVSAIKEVRVAMVAQQQAMGRDKGVVMDGRDIGSVVFPDAELKVFMTASTEVRAKRRQAELAAKGEEVALNEIIANLESRDHQDSTRAESPLIKVDDAIEIDTSDLRFEDQVQKVLNLANNRIEKAE